MLISDLPEDIRKIAYQRREETDSSRRGIDISSDDLNYAFYWAATPEGHLYWSRLNGNYLEDLRNHDDGYGNNEDDGIFK